ncbi:M48 family metallopeptidase [Rhizobium sp. AAP43]|uniref:M48 family metallopeptidase n=1 Tax=Rhizobium sp. AAP43 TaxID=1523420 RepID=UPI0006B97D50|nr:M48 family metallopeptidase [Rhizobium sp. AAP43]KPF41623.1 metalloprotease [Rhizobium sp. AAP43]
MASDDKRIALGRWHPPGASRSSGAEILAEGKTLYVRLEGEVADPVTVGDLSRLDISDRIGRVPRRITFPDGSMFETDDNAALDDWLSRHRSTGFVHKLEAFHPRLIAFVIAVFLLAGGIYRYALPAMVEVAVLVTPPAATEWMASGALTTLDKAVFEETELPEARQKEILDAFHQVADVSAKGRDAYTLNFRSGGLIGPNAFALPDGNLVITDELIELAGTDMDMILGVLAHEIGHVEQKHSLRQMYRAAGMTGLIMLIAGDIGTAAEDVLTGGAALMTMSHSRGAENEADRISVELMAKAGRDPRAVGRFFEKLEKELGLDGDEGSMLSTHPPTAERKQAIEAHALELGFPAQ